MMMLGSGISDGFNKRVGSVYISLCVVVGVLCLSTGWVSSLMDLDSNMIPLNTKREGSSELTEVWWPDCVGFGLCICF
jgi:hypothetical protein